MADDIQIKSGHAYGNAGTQGSQNGAQISSAGTNAGAKPNTEQAPVIDLSQLEVAKGSTPAQTQAQPTGYPAPAYAAPQPPAPAKAQPAAAGGALSLEEAAMTAAGQSMMAPPEKYSIPDLVKQKFPNLVSLIKETESMNDEERDYWFQILPIMTEDQIKKFQDILLNEKNQLQKLDQEYEGELTKLNEKHMLEWKEFESKEKRKALTQAEQVSKQQEQATEEDLLKRLSSEG